MKGHDVPVYKAMHFDLSINCLSQYYSMTNPKHGYSLISNFLKANGYRHEQYSGYHSIHPTTDMKVFDLVRLMQDKLPWFDKCVKKFEVSDLRDNYDLMKVITRNVKRITDS